MAQPMRCLCEAKLCRGFIGGTGEAVAQEQDLEDAADASEDPEPIMVSELEAGDPALVAILESEVGLASEFWDASVWQRYAQCYISLLCSDGHQACIDVCGDNVPA